MFCHQAPLNIDTNVHVKNKENLIHTSTVDLFQRCGPRDDIANKVIFKLNLGSLELYILFFVK